MTDHAAAGLMFVQFVPRTELCQIIRSADGTTFTGTLEK